MRILTLLVLLSGICFADRMVLNEGSWKPVDSVLTAQQQDFSKLVQLADKGKDKEFVKAARQYQATYPDVATDASWAAFIEAEKLFALGKIEKASVKFYKLIADFPMGTYYEASIDGLYKCGQQFLAGKKKRFLVLFTLSAFDDGEQIMRDVADKSSNDFLAMRAFFTLAESYERRELYIDAYNVWVEIATRWPTGENGRESLLQMARTMHQAYLGPKYDASTLKSAEGYYGQFIARYPEQAETLKIADSISLAKEQMASKILAIAKYYYNGKDFETSLAYLNQIEKSWPTSTIISEVILLKEKCNAELAKLADNPRIKPEDKNLLWRFAHFFDFDVK